MGRADRRIILKQTMAEVARGGMDLRAPSADQSWAGDRRDAHPDRHPAAATARRARARRPRKRTSSSRPRSSAMPPASKIECAKGCAFCCYVAVSALAPEVFLVANTIRAQHASDFETRSRRASTRVERATHRLERLRTRAAEASLRAARELHVHRLRRAAGPLPRRDLGLGASMRAAFNGARGFDPHARRSGARCATPRSRR